jgi:hypothetical protein
MYCGGVSKELGLSSERKRSSCIYGMASALSGRKHDAAWICNIFATKINVSKTNQSVNLG